MTIQLSNFLGEIRKKRKDCLILCLSYLAGPGGQGQTKQIYQLRRSSEISEKEIW